MSERIEEKSRMMSSQMLNIDKDRNKTEPNRNSGVENTITEMKNSLEG